MSPDGIERFRSFAFYRLTANAFERRTHRPLGDPIEDSFERFEILDRLDRAFVTIDDVNYGLYTFWIGVEHMPKRGGHTGVDAVADILGALTQAFDPYRRMEWRYDAPELPAVIRELREVALRHLGKEDRLKPRLYKERLLHAADAMIRSGQLPSFDVLRPFARILRAGAILFPGVLAHSEEGLAVALEEEFRGKAFLPKVDDAHDVVARALSVMGLPKKTIYNLLEAPERQRLSRERAARGERELKPRRPRRDGPGPRGSKSRP